ncbi:C-X-C motif chemokine 9 Small-inducible cytokine B9 Precursor [Channa argus]|uniref:C-X-C motif chemokine 9 Small-inducible cytokine B9 n=1 Tax=Channa argus TaxID=215402 RepID=A0A6G1PAR8_CHAAH|nr:C-X-C motif chemokine 9 Small-inducible cytokine B9 Precursor [Channa argus]
MVSQKGSTLLLIVVAAVSIQFYQAHDIGRCNCLSTQKFIKGNISDFEVREKSPACDNIELIVTLKNADNSTDKICMNTGGQRAKAYLKCWERINKDESRKMECIDRKKKAE